MRLIIIGAVAAGTSAAAKARRNREDIEIVRAKRIGIDYAEEYKDKLWRFYIKNNKFISKK